MRRAVLLSKFIEGSAEDWDYVAAVLTNVTRMPDGRKLLLDPQRGFLRALATQLRSPSLTRRRGCAAAFRNCAFGAQVCCEARLCLFCTVHASRCSHIRLDGQSMCLMSWECL